MIISIMIMGRIMFLGFWVHIVRKRYRLILVCASNIIKVIYE